jgi:putative ABC transport system permease protein
MLLKQPGFSLIAALTLALGIGATSAIFSLIQGVLLTPPPYQNPGQLMLVPTVRTDGKDMERPRGWPAEQWMNWGNEAKLLQGIAGYDWTFNFLIHNDGSHSMQGMVVTRDYMHVMGLRPSAGRGFAAVDFQQGPTKAIMLGYDSGSASLAGIPRSSARPCESAVGWLPPQ